ncbi:SDR family oxidoreductase [Mycobacterium sp.]|uniref:SDR family oxidoreductase n=1 Tax=Mycobacterium sp. TaxID=1785 RepID=UPI003C761007
MRVLMVGATGRHAHWVLPELRKRGVEVRALVRNQERAQLARRNGADEVAIGDLTEPGSLADAVAGVEGVFHIGPAHAAGEAEMGLAMVDAARAAGVRKFVFSGVIHPSISAMTNHTAKLAVEEALYSSQLDFTVLQPARFMQNFEQSWNDIVEHGRLAQPYSLASKMCSVHYRDVAEVAAMAMTGDELSYGTFELCAPGMHDTYDTAAVISEVLRRPVSAVRIPLDQFASRLPEGSFRDGMTRMMVHYDRCGLPGGNPLVLRAILGREPRSLKDYFRELASR